MLRRDDPEATIAKGTLTETKGPRPALALKHEREGITMLGYEERLPLPQLVARWLRRPLILIIPTGLVGRRPPVSV